MINKINSNKNATYLKTILIDYWVEKYKPELIINEFPFLKGDRRADLVFIQNNNLVGLEIKSELDSLKNLNIQIDNYIKVFDFVYILIDKKFLKSKEIKLLNKNVGIIIYNNNLIVKRHAKNIKKFKKEDLISLLWRKDLDKLSNKKYICLEDLKKEICKNYKIQEIKQQITIALKERYGITFNSFLRDRGNFTTIDDLQTITRIKKEHLLF